MPNIPTIPPKLALALCAAVAAIALATVWHPQPAHADGGASARSQGASPETTRAYTLRILRALTNRDANNWPHYWQARDACDAILPPAPAAPVDRALLALTATLCAQLDALIGVSLPPAQSPPAGERSVGLLINEPGAALGYTLFMGRYNNDVFLLDPLGKVAHIWRMDTPFQHAKLIDNGNLLVTGWDIVFEFDPRGNIVWQYKVGNRLHHDFLKMPNGNVLLIVRKTKTREEAIAAGANPAFVGELGIMYDNAIEVRPIGASGGEVVWEWAAWDHIVQDFDPSKPNYGAIAEHPELINLNFILESLSKRGPRDSGNWMHANSIDYNPELDQIMMSPRHYSELWIIDHSATTEEARGSIGGNSGMGGGLLYRWGNPRAYGQGDAQDQRLFWQHQTHWIPPGMPGAGNILLFNNGNEFPGYERYHSSIDELVPPADGYRYRRAPNSPYPPPEPAWSYAAETPTDFYAPVLSGAQRLPNGNTLIVDGMAGTISQAAPDSRIVWKYVVPLNRSTHLRQGDLPPAGRTYPTPYGDPVPLLANGVHRAYWYPPSHPGLKAMDLTPGAFIEDLPDIHDKARATVAAAIAGDLGDPVARSNFNIYLDDEAEDNRWLIYIKQPCASDDARALFFLHIFTAHARDLPVHRQEHGFDNLDFNVSGRDVYSLDDWCVAMRRLPLYPIERIRAGQFTGSGVLWQADINLNE